MVCFVSFTTHARKQVKSFPRVISPQLFPPAVILLFCPSHPQLLPGPLTHQEYFCLRTFAPAVEVLDSSSPDMAGSLTQSWSVSSSWLFYLKLQISPHSAFQMLLSLFYSFAYHIIIFFLSRWFSSLPVPGCKLLAGKILQVRFFFKTDVYPGPNPCPTLSKYLCLYHYTCPAAGLPTAPLCTLSPCPVTPPPPGPCPALLWAWGAHPVLSCALPFCLSLSPSHSSFKEKSIFFPSTSNTQSWVLPCQWPSLLLPLRAILDMYKSDHISPLVSVALGIKSKRLATPFEGPRWPLPASLLPQGSGNSSSPPHLATPLHFYCPSAVTPHVAQATLPPAGTQHGVPLHFVPSTRSSLKVCVPFCEDKRAQSGSPGADQPSAAPGSLQDHQGTF